MEIRKDLTNGSIAKHLVAIAIPASFGFLFNTLYNVVDALFAKYISTEAVAALGYSSTIFFLIISASVGISQGAAALTANFLGKEMKGAEGYVNSTSMPDHSTSQVFAQTLLLALLVSILTLGLLWTLSPAILKSLGATGEAYKEALTYTELLVLSSPFAILTSALTGSLNARGDTLTFGFSLFLAAVLNALFNGLFVFFLGWGMWGIGMATLVVQFLALLYCWWRFSKTDVYQALSAQDFRPRFPLLFDGLRQTVPAMLSMLSIAATFFIMTAFFARFGDPAVAAFLIANRVTQITFLPTIGVGIAILAIAGQNFGAGKHDRVRLVFRQATLSCLAFTLGGALLLYVAGHHFVNLFSNDPAVLEIGHAYIWVLGLTLPALVLANIPIALMQALKAAFFAPISNTLRLIVAPFLLITYLLDGLRLGIEALYWGEFAVFWVMGLAVFVACSVLLKLYLRNE